MEAKYRISEKDYVNANKLSGKVTFKAALFYVVGLLLLAFLIVSGSPAIAGGAIGALIAALIVRYIITPIVAKNNYRKYKAIQDEFKVQLLEDSVKFIFSNGEGKVGWDSILKWRQNDEFILIYPMPSVYYIIPKYIASSGFNVDELINRLERHVGKSA